MDTRPFSGRQDNMPDLRSLSQNNSATSYIVPIDTQFSSTCKASLLPQPVPICVEKHWVVAHSRKSCRRQNTPRSKKSKNSHATIFLLPTAPRSMTNPSSFHPSGQSLRRLLLANFIVPSFICAAPVFYLGN